jgi:hypothetical protein
MKKNLGLFPKKSELGSPYCLKNSTKVKFHKLFRVLHKVEFFLRNIDSLKKCAVSVHN